MNFPDAVAKLEKKLVRSSLVADERKWREGGGIITVKELSSFLKGKDEIFRGSHLRLTESLVHSLRNNSQSSQEAKLRPSCSKFLLGEEDEKPGRSHRGLVGASIEKESLKEQTTCGGNNEGDWKGLSPVLLRRKTFSSIPNQELMKMAELRFSSDMHEGDSGDKVSFLQRALFLLGYLPHDSYVSGYFGTETKKALQDFQKAYGVHDSGSWDSLSKEAIWHNISAEILHRVDDQNVDYGNQSATNLNRRTSTATKAGIQIRQTMRQFKPWVVSERILGAIPKHDWKLSSGWSFSLAILFGGVLLGFMKFKSSIDRSLRQQSVRRRILKSQWYGSSARRSRANRAFEKERSESIKGLPVENELLCLQPRANFITRNGHGRVQTNDGDVSEDSSLDLIYSNQNDRQGQLRYGKNGSALWEKEDLPESRDGRWPSQPSQYKVSKTNGSFFTTGERERPKFSSSNATNHAPFDGASNVDTSKALQNIKSSNGYLNGTSRGALSQDLFCNDGKLYSHQVGKDDAVMAERYSDGLAHKRALGNARKRESLLSRESLNERDLGPKPISSGIRRANKTWKEEDEIEELRKTVRAAEQNRHVAMRALAEERQRSLELEVKISRQREAAAALEEEVRVLKESHDALLASLRKKYSSSAASRAAAALLYQHWDSYDENDYCKEESNHFKSPAC